MSAMLTEAPVKTFTSGATLAKYRRVRISGSTLAYAGASDQDALGQVESDCVSGDTPPVRLVSAQGTAICVANGAISQWATVYAAASGKVASSGTVVVGIALTASAADGEQITVLPSPSGIVGSIARSGLTTDSAAIYSLSLYDAVVTGTGARLGTAAGTPSGAHGITVGTLGTASPKLVGEAASNNSKTNKCRFMFALPAEYVAAGTVTLRVKARITGNVQVSQTIDAQVYESDGAAGISADLCATNLQSLTTSFVNKDFTITATNLVAGDILDIELASVADDTGGSANKLIEIGAVQLLCDIKG